MKELSIKQKAERYDEISKEVKDFFDGKQKMYSDVEQTLNHLFPELKESEDDRIRKAIMEFFELQDDNTTYSFIPKKDILAWLEKQGKHLENYDEAEKEKTEFVGDGFIKCHADFLDFKEGNTYWLEYIGDDKYNVRSDNLLGQTYHITPGQLYTVFKKLTWIGNWIGKRGGNLQFWKPTKEQFEALDYAYNSCPDTERGNYYEGVLETLIDDLHRLEKQGEKPQGKSALEAAKEKKVDTQNCVNPTNNPEPEFHEGDFIVNDYCQGKIIELTSDAYLLDTGQGIPFSCEDSMHLWTIQDAKDGDVLVASDGSIFLFAGVVDCACKYYAVLTTFNEVKIKKEVYDSGYWETSRAVHPATKNQRDLLFQKMSEAGYEWDAEKKELKKIKMADLLEDYIEQKPVKWNEEDEQHINSLLKRLDGLCRNEFERTRFAISEDRAWLKSLKERIGG